MFCALCFVWTAASWHVLTMIPITRLYVRFGCTVWEGMGCRKESEMYVA